MVAFGIDVDWLLPTTAPVASGGCGACKGDGEGDALVRLGGVGAGADVASSAGRSDPTSAARVRAGTEATRSARLTSEVSTSGDHRGPCVARTSPKAMTVWNSTEQITATPITSSGRRLSPWLRLLGEYRRGRRRHPPPDSARCSGVVMGRTAWSSAATG